MTLELRRYESYRESGLPWLGQIPSHWEVHKVRNLFARIGSGTTPPTGHAHYYRDGTIPWVVTGDLKNGALDTVKNNVTERAIRELPALRIYPEKTVIVAMYGATIGKVGLLLHPSCVNQACCALTPPGRIIPEYALQLFISVRSDLVHLGVGGGQPNIRQQTIRDFRVPLPPYDEQLAIVRYLETQNRRLVSLIRNKRRLIALLTEQKQAIIQQAVTRGLDPDVPLKPSGVAWLGDIPAHWEVRRNGAIFRLRKEFEQPSLPILEVTIQTGVRVRDVENLQRKQMMSDLGKYQVAHTGDIAYNMMRMWQGAVGVVPTDGLVSPAYVVIEPNQLANSRFFAFIYRTQMYMSVVDQASRGIVKDRNRLYWDDYKQLPVPIPPLDEQRRIVEFLTDQASHVDGTIANALREIDLIREYRTRVIADVVTGQIDVRHLMTSVLEAQDDVTVQTLVEGGAET